MVAKALFSSTTDEWSTPSDFFEKLDAEFGFDVDVCATEANAKCNVYFGPDSHDPEYRDGFKQNWHVWSRTGEPTGAVCWMNPPYSQIRSWMEKASAQAARGATVVCLVPARVDTRWWGATVWDFENHRPHPGVEVRFVKGRLKFGGAKNSAPFPSVVVVFRPPVAP